MDEPAELDGGGHHTPTLGAVQHDPCVVGVPQLLAAGLAVFLAAVSLKEPLTLNIVISGAVIITIIRAAMIQFLKPRRKQKGKL